MAAEHLVLVATRGPPSSRSTRAADAACHRRAPDPHQPHGVVRKPSTPRLQHLGRGQLLDAVARRPRPRLHAALLGSPTSSLRPARPAAVIAARHESSGCATAVSLISSASAVVPHRIRSQPASSEAAPRNSATPGTSSHGARKPGVCAPCPGAVIMSILIACPVDVRHLHARQYEVARQNPVAFLQTVFIWALPSRYPSRRGSGHGHPRERQVCFAPRRPRAIATHRVKPSRPTEGA